MPAECLACPRCGERVDEVDGKPVAIPTVAKRISGSHHHRHWPQDAHFVYCPHCGAVLGVLPAPG